VAAASQSPAVLGRLQGSDRFGINRRDTEMARGSTWTKRVAFAAAATGRATKSSRSVLHLGTILVGVARHWLSWEWYTATTEVTSCLCKAIFGRRPRASEVAHATRPEALAGERSTAGAHDTHANHVAGYSSGGRATRWSARRTPSKGALVGGLQANRVERRKVVRLILANGHELQQEVAIIPENTRSVVSP
jgi:hypothetical protein